MAEKALELDSFLAEPHVLLAWIYKNLGNWNQAVTEAQTAVSISPAPDNLYRYARILDNVGRPKEAIEMCLQAMKTDPIPPAWARGVLTGAYFMAGQYGKARDECRRNFDHVEKLEPKTTQLYAHIQMAAIYARLGQMEQARRHAAEVPRIDPRFSLVSYEKLLPYKDARQKERLISALRLAGLE